MASSTVTDPYLQAYYDTQRRNVNDSYQMGLAQNAEQKSLSTLSYQQKLSALQDKLNQEQTTMPDTFANRGILHSGIYYWNQANAGSLGALQQFKVNKATALGNLQSQQGALDASYGLKGTQLGTTFQDNMDNINQMSAADQARAAVNDAIAGA